VYPYVHRGAKILYCMEPDRHLRTVNVIQRLSMLMIYELGLEVVESLPAYIAFPISPWMLCLEEVEDAVGLAPVQGAGHVTDKI
jgi:hypothetical protein